MEKKSFEQLNNEYNVALATLGFKTMVLSQLPKEIEELKANIEFLAKEVQANAPKQTPAQEPAAVQ